MALELKKKLPQATDEVFYRELRKGLGDNPSRPSKRSEVAIAKMADYELSDDLLRRKVYHQPSSAWTTRLAVPDKGMRSFMYNGRTYRLTLRRTILLLHHDSEMMGGHPGVRDTVAKVSNYFHWPTLEHDVRNKADS